MNGNQHGGLLFHACYWTIWKWMTLGMEYTVYSLALDKINLNNLWYGELLFCMFSGTHGQNKAE